jgi:hypothetical protein
MFAKHALEYFPTHQAVSDLVQIPACDNARLAASGSLARIRNSVCTAGSRRTLFCSQLRHVATGIFSRSATSVCVMPSNCRTLPGEGDTNLRSPRVRILTVLNHLGANIRLGGRVTFATSTTPHANGSQRRSFSHEPSVPLLLVRAARRDDVCRVAAHCVNHHVEA